MKKGIHNRPALRERAGSRGFTLVELLVATAVLGLIVAVAMPIVLQFIQGSERSSASASALNNLNNAAHWISRDAQMAQDISPALVNGGTPLYLPADSNFIEFAWIDQYRDAYTDHYSRYSLSNGELQREYDGSTGTIAGGVTNLSFFMSDSTITVSITCVEAEASETKTYEILMRPIQ